MDVISCCGYGIELDSISQPNHPVVVNAKKILNVDISFNQIMCFMFPRIAQLLKLEVFDKKAVNYFDKLTFEIVEKRLKQTDVKREYFQCGLSVTVATPCVFSLGAALRWVPK